MSFRDWAYFITALIAISFVVYKYLRNKDIGASTSFIAVVVVCEIMSRFTYGHFIGETMPNKVAASVDIIALLSLMFVRGGGVIKLTVILLYSLIVLTNYLYDVFFLNVPFPYLHIIRVLSYTQLGVLLLSTKIERFSWYGSFSIWLVNSPVLGLCFSYYISNRFNGLETAYQREAKK